MRLQILAQSDNLFHRETDYLEIEAEPAAPFWRQQALIYKHLAKHIIDPWFFEDD